LITAATTVVQRQQDGGSVHSGAAFLIATAYMFTIPMLTGFSITSFFGGGA
jgi:hypothetical protein